jgi:hypothetical protein
MPKDFRIRKMALVKHESNQREGDSSAMDNADPQHHKAIEAIFAPRKAWLRMLDEQSSEGLKACKETFWFMPSFCWIPMEWSQRSFAVYLACQQCVTESIEQQTLAANLTLVQALRSDSVVREDSIEHAMDIAVGAVSVGHERERPKALSIAA